MLTPQKEAFCLAYGVRIPRIPLCRIAHWEAMMRGLTGAELAVHNDVAHVAPGYFYFGSSTVPDEVSFHKLISEAGDADWLLIPSLEPCQSLKDRIFGQEVIKVPFLQAAFFETKGDFENSLCNTIGRNRYKEILRLTKKAELACEVRICRLSDVADNNQVLKTFVDLQALNVEKYGHANNPYNHNAFFALAGSSEATNYYLKITYCKESKLPLHVSLSYADSIRGIFTQLVQGQDRAQVPKGLNLYVSDYYQLYAFADSMGYICHGLGRGAIEIKKRLGANRIIQLENWLVPIKATDKNAMVRFAAMRREN